MPDFGALVVEEAREWLGTPFHWQASRKQVGCDCKGLVAGVARALGRPEADSLFALKADYQHRVDTKLLREGMEALFDRVDDMQPGDILLLIVGNQPQHLAIYIGNGRMIHTYGKGPERVVNVRVGQSRPIDSIWRWRDG